MTIGGERHDNEGGGGAGGLRSARPILRISEDVAATVLGLVLLGLILVGAIPKGILP